MILQKRLPWVNGILKPQNGLIAFDTLFFPMTIFMIALALWLVTKMTMWSEDYTAYRMDKTKRYGITVIYLLQKSIEEWA